MSRQSSRLMRIAISNADRHAKAPLISRKDHRAGRIWKANVTHPTIDKANNATGNRKKVRNRRRTCGSRLRFSKTYTMNSQGLIGVQNGM